MKAFSIELIWTRFNKVWMNNNVISKLVDCLDMPKDFCSWLLLYCQEEIVKDHYTAEAQVATKTPEAEMREQDKGIVTYICGAALSKLI